jgi:hypothetical protein
MNPRAAKEKTIDCIFRIVIGNPFANPAHFAPSTLTKECCYEIRAATK